MGHGVVGDFCSWEKYLFLSIKKSGGEQLFFYSVYMIRGAKGGCHVALAALLHEK